MSEGTVGEGTAGVVLMAYGTPRGPEDVERYYTDIRRGRPPTAEQLADLVRRYDAIGGISPLAERTEAQRRAIQAVLDDRAPGCFEVVLGLKHAAPTIEEAVESLAARGVARAVGLVLAPHFSALSVGQYHERAAAAASAAGIGFSSIDEWHLLPAFVAFEAEQVRTAMASLPAETRVLFTAHSLPERIVAMGDPYPEQLRATATAIAAQAGVTDWDTAWQSAGRTPEPWLGPDLLTVIDDLAAGSPCRAALVCACGFVADHLEVLYDLDIEAAGRAASHGLAFARTGCVNDTPSVMGALAGLVLAAS